MNKEEKVFEMMKAVAPVLVTEGISLQKRLIDLGSNPADCKVGGMSIVDSYAQSAKEWAEAFVNALNATPEQHDATKNEPSDVMDTYNGHNAELVRKINAAWKSPKYHDEFEGILHALLERDYEEYCDKFETPDVTTSDYAMSHAHEIMEGVCDDWDLETILSFIRYKED